jgi:hypothetical protein
MCADRALLTLACQKRQWPTHKGLCHGSRKTIPFPLVKLFHPLPDGEDSFGTIIDTFRLRCEDDYSQGAHYHGIYAEADPIPVLRIFSTGQRLWI